MGRRIPTTYGQTTYGATTYGYHEAPEQGSWYSLRDIAVEARQYHQALMLAGLQACPYDGEPLQMGAPRAQGQRHCRVCGRLYR
jgi:hypothetical protein